MLPVPETENQSVPSQSGIKWNAVTWYSTTFAILLFVAFVCGAFFFGIWYQNQQDLNISETIKTTPTDNSTDVKVINSESWNTFHIAAQLPGAPAFDISYPTQFGDPHTSVEIGNLGHIDFENNVEKINFYKSSYQPTDSDKYLSGFFTIVSLQQGQTLTNFANAQLLPTAVNKIQTSFTVDGRAVISQKISSTSPETFYYLEFKDDLVMALTLSKPRGSEADAQRFGILTEAQVIEDKIVQSIKFAN